VGETFASGSGSHFEAAEIRGILTASIAGTILHDAPEAAALYTAQLSLRGHTVNLARGIHANPDGSFAFTGLMPDTYTLTVILPAAWPSVKRKAPFSAVPAAPRRPWKSP
jgi:hypothetical protein